MDSTGFLLFLLLATVVTMVSYGLDLLYARIIPVRVLYSALRMPGVILHELAHVLGCLVTGAEISKVVLFSQGGGSVTYAEPKIPVLGRVIIGTAPLLVLSLCLALMTGICSEYFGCSPGALPSGELNGTAAYRIIASAAGILIQNLVVEFNGWFLLYLYLMLSITLSLAPSRQDFMNAAAGIAALAIIILLVIGSGHSGALGLMDRILTPLSSAFTAALLSEAIAAGTSLPLILIAVLRSGR